ncbi:4679_t:CDS:2 [Funneliformis geosporum]|uniref:2090_t:CDS:1 n=1 Tax=Funneliformis geosporum TaxID=1117311 RepID=A0A9W4SUI7_9GLOM|nr:2090_t:CDS:2 [Funneliformis geosporum]CAI2183241.1 4679_t:CDS:2 [Funneliformis geosporum]
MKLSPLIVAFLTIAAFSDAAPLDKRRFFQEHTPAAEATFRGMRALAVGTPFGERLGDLSGLAVDNLLAKAPACGQQIVADEVVDIAKKIGGKKKDQLIKVAIAYRKLERNTPLKGQPSNFCDKRPRNKELLGVVQAQDPTKVQPKPPAFVSPGEKLNKKPTFGNVTPKVEEKKKVVKKGPAKSKKQKKAVAKCVRMLKMKHVSPGQKKKCEKLAKKLM